MNNEWYYDPIIVGSIRYSSTLDRMMLFAFALCRARLQLWFVLPVLQHYCTVVIYSVYFSLLTVLYDTMPVP